MNGFLQTMGRLGPVRLVALAAVAAGMLGFFLYLGNRVAAPTYSVLYSELELKDSGQIVQKLEANKNSFGVFGYSFLEENAAKLKGVALNGTAPTFEAIAAGKYDGARPLFIYIKKQHVGLVPGLDKFAAEYVSARALGEDGYLAKKGLVTLPKNELETVRKSVTGMSPMQSPSS